MTTSPDRRSDSLWFVLAAVLFAAVAVYLVGLLLVGADASRVRSEAVPLLVTVLFAGGATLLGWRRERQRAREAQEAAEETRERLEREEQSRQEVEQRRAELEDTLADRQSALEEVREERDRERGEKERSAEQLEGESRRAGDLEEEKRRIEEEKEKERERLERTVREREETIDHERSLRERVQRARGAEREWARELREQLSRMHQERGALASTDDVPTLVLHTAVTLLDARKGLLFSREDADGDGDLDLVRWEGFDADPSGSRLAQRFAGEVIERDATVRDDDLAGDGSGRADEEIDSLVAIPIYIQDKFSGVVVCANRPGGFEEYDDQVLISLGDHAGAVLQNGRLQGELRSAYLATVRMLAEAIEAKDPLLRGHSEEVSSYVAGVAERLQMRPGRREELVFGSLLHDVGKIGISERILLKPGPLTPEERNLCELHPRIGYRLVQQVPTLRPIAPAILHHHERFDGGGYPAGLRGEQIPLEARVVCVADSFSAMTAERPYRGRLSIEEACTELERCAGSQFDPEIVRIFVEEVRKRPPSTEPTAIASAFDDPELLARRAGNEPVLGSGAFAITDNLTLLYSHRYLHEVAGSEAERAAVQNRPFSVALVELTGVAEVNGLQSYAAGDELIQSVAHSVQRFAQQEGGTAARYSGRRLALIAPGMDDDGAAHLSAEMEEAFSSGPPVRVAVATWAPGDDGDAVLSRARAGLLTAAANGGPDREPALAGSAPLAPAPPNPPEGFEGARPPHAAPRPPRL